MLPVFLFPVNKDYQISLNFIKLYKWRKEKCTALWWWQYGMSCGRRKHGTNETLNAERLELFSKSVDMLLSEPPAGRIQMSLRENTDADATNGRI